MVWTPEIADILRTYATVYGEFPEIRDIGLLHSAIERPQAVASAFEVGLHNATLAIVIAQSVLNSPEMTLPGAVYGVLMFPLAAAFGFLITRGKTEAA